MTHTMCGRRVPWEWMPLAMANGIEWAATERRYERLYRWPQHPRLVPCHLLYVLGWLVGKVARSWWRARLTKTELCTTYPPPLRREPKSRTGEQHECKECGAKAGTRSPDPDCSSCFERVYGAREAG